MNEIPVPEAKVEDQSKKSLVELVEQEVAARILDAIGHVCLDEPLTIDVALQCLAQKLHSRTYISASEALKLMETLQIAKPVGHVRKLGLYKVKGFRRPSKSAYFIVGGACVVRQPFRHNTVSEAITEAQRLAATNPNQVFTVFGAIAKFKWFRDLPPVFPEEANVTPVETSLVVK